MFVNLIENISDGAADHDYDLRSIIGSKSIRSDIAATLDLPATLTISHVKSGSGLKTSRRSLVSLDQQVEDAAGNQDLLRAYMVLVVPEKVTTVAAVVKQITLLKSFLATATFIDKIVAQEI